MSDPFKKVRPGAPLNIPAPTWNGLVKMLQQYGPGSVEAARGVHRQFPAGLAVVKNAAGIPLETGYLVRPNARKTSPTPTDDLDGVHVRTCGES